MIGVLIMSGMGRWALWVYVLVGKALLGLPSKASLSLCICVGLILHLCRSFIVFLFLNSHIVFTPSYSESECTNGLLLIAAFCLL